MLMTAKKLAEVTGTKISDNLRSVHKALTVEAKSAGLDRPHRLVPFLAQLSHESQGFRYDRELWGPTPAQKRYDTRTDLGNTAAVDGDGYKNRGRGPIQVTGAYNIAEFYSWCVARFGSTRVPDFRANPDRINTDPWEGLSAIWYWSTRKINALADRGDFRAITKIINGGYNGHTDRLDRYSKIGLAMMGYKRTVVGVRQFQADAGFAHNDIDGLMGPMTRKAIHVELLKLPDVSFRDEQIMPEPPAPEPTSPKPVVPSVWTRFVAFIRKFLNI